MADFNDIDSFFKNKFFAAEDFKISLNVDGVLTWVRPTVIANALVKDFNEATYDPEIRIRHENAYIHEYSDDLKQVARIPQKSDVKKIDIITREIIPVQCTTIIEHLTKDPIVDNWLATEFLKRLKRVSEFRVSEKSGKKDDWIVMMLDDIVELNNDKTYRRAYRYKTEFSIVTTSKREATRARSIKIKVGPIPETARGAGANSAKIVSDDGSILDSSRLTPVDIDIKL
jgi:hypothetical protein